MFMVDTAAAVTLHPLDGTSGEGDPRPLILPRPLSLDWRRSGSGVVPAVDNEDSGSCEAPEVGGLPCAGGEKPSCDPVIQPLAQVIRAKSAHRMPAKEDAIPVNVEAVFALPDDRGDVLVRLRQVPALVAFLIPRRGRGHRDKGSLLDVRPKPVAILIVFRTNFFIPSVSSSYNFIGESTHNFFCLNKTTQATS